MNKQITINNNSKINFFTKKRIISLLIFFAITIAIIVITLIYVLKIDVIKLFTSFFEGMSLSKYQFIFVLYLLFFPLIKSFCLLSFVIFTLRKEKIKIRKRDWVIFAFTLAIISSITPTDLGSQPYMIFWLNKKINDVKRSSAIVLCSNFIFKIAGLIIKLPVFIYFCFTLNSSFFINQENIFSFGFLVYGIVIELLMFIIIICLIYTKKLQYFLSIIFHKIKKILKAKYKTKQEIEDEVIKNEIFKKLVNNYLKNVSIFIKTLLVFTFYNCIYYISMYCSMAIFIGTSNIDFFGIFNATALSIIANSYIPIPGGEGTLQIFLKIFIPNGAIGIDPNKYNLLLDNSIFTWRLSTTQASSLIGFFLLFIELIKFIISLKYRKLNENLPNKKDLLFIVDNFEMENNKKLKNYYDSLTNYFGKSNIEVFKTNNDISLFFSLKNKLINFYKFIRINKKNIKITKINLSKKLLKNNYDLIIDFSFFSTKELAKKNNYIWVQSCIYDDYTGYKIFKSKYKNFIAKNIKKLSLPYDPFYLNKNIFITYKKDLLIGSTNNSFYVSPNDILNKGILSKIFL